MEREREGMDFLLKAMLTGDPSGVIEASEREGQRQATACGRDRTVMISSKLDDETREFLTHYGVEFLGDDDTVLQRVKLPPGWRLEPTDHAMWNDLVDANGHKRASMFYKAAFYDRNSHMHLERRFIVTHEYGDAEYGSDAYNEKCSRVVVKDRQFDEPTWSKKWLTKDECHVEYPAKSLRDEHDAMASAWLAEHYPDHESVHAYWDEQPSLPDDESEIVGCQPEDEEDFERDSAIAKSIVPPGCKLHGLLVLAIHRDGGDPCSGCNENRTMCGGRMKG
jgi:hypothetical protein